MSSDPRVELRKALITYDQTSGGARVAAAVVLADCADILLTWLEANHIDYPVQVSALIDN